MEEEDFSEEEQESDDEDPLKKIIQSRYRIRFPSLSNSVYD